jgi:hypothetical protein
MTLDGIVGRVVCACEYYFYKIALTNIEQPNVLLLITCGNQKSN